MSLLVYRSFEGRRREPLAGKVVRDGEQMYNLARRVIVLDRLGNVIEDFRNDPEVSVNCIAILGPIVYRKQDIPKAVLLEIGLKRFVPYGPGLFPGKREHLTSRFPVARLSDRASIALLPIISKAIQEEVDLIVLSWEKTKPYLKVAKSRSLLGGNADHSYELNQRVFVKVPKEDYILSVAMLLSERAWRSGHRRHYDVVAESVREKLRDFLSIVGKRYAEGVPDAKIKRSALCIMIAEAFITRITVKGYRQHAVDEVLARIGKPGSPERILLERVFEVHKVPPAPVEEILVFKPPVEHKGETLLAQLGGLICYRSMRHTDRRKVHAPNCIVFTVLCSNECQETMNRRLVKKTAKQTSEADEDLDDIPF